VAACGDDRNDPPYRSARSSLLGRALAPRSQFGVQMKPAVPVIDLAGPWYNNRSVYSFWLVHFIGISYPYSPVPYELALVNIAGNYALYARAYWAILRYYL
jgi:hypothetical protein